MILFLSFEVKAVALPFELSLKSSLHFLTRWRPPWLFMSRKQIVLASTSPFRRELLSRLGLPFEVANPKADEAPLNDEAPQATALRLSEAKARAVVDEFSDALIVGSDQVAFLDGQLFGKPGTHANAVEQLQTMSGRTVNFFTGLCVLDAQSNRVQIAGVPTLVTFRDLTRDEIENYLRIEQPYNCAGSAKSEGLGIALIARMEGEDPNALIGLPLIKLCDFLKKENINII